MTSCFVGSKHSGSEISSSLVVVYPIFWVLALAVVAVAVAVAVAIAIAECSGAEEENNAVLNCRNPFFPIYQNERDTKLQTTNQCHAQRFALKLW
mmetsp:Transcript_4377/g.10940  ORF Transcript_4377/g.10940 Transcript_4377/m.10940 type:complete len:95 (-) Transcript_4377:513-797(-)